LINPGEKEGDGEPKQDDAEKDDGGGYQYFFHVCRLIGQGLGWPYRWWRAGDHRRRTANATVLLAVVTLILALANLGMLNEMRRSGDQQHRDTLAAIGKTDDTLKALQDQTRIMGDQLSIMREQATSMSRQFAITEAQLRPRLSLSIERSDELRNTNTYEMVNGRYFTPVWKNTGSVAPEELIGWSHIRFFQGYSVGVLAPDPFRLGQEDVPLTLLTPSSANSYEQSSEFFEARELQQVHTKTVQLIAWGYIQYRDPFPGAPLHHINWCQKLIYIQTPKGPGAAWMPHSPDCNRED